VNQTDEVEIIRHGRELAANRMGHQKESAIEHEHDNAAEASRAFKGFSANGNNPLKPVSQSRGALQGTNICRMPFEAMFSSEKEVDQDRHERS
jgi:hypothetical protein